MDLAPEYLSDIFFDHPAWHEVVALAICGMAEKIAGDICPRAGKFYIDHPPVPLAMALRNSTILFVLSGLAAFLLNGQLGLTAWQLFLIMVGFMLMYRDRLFFGAPVTYVIAVSGIGIHLVSGHMDYRLFLNFNEIARIERCAYQKNQGWDLFARTRAVGDGLLLIPKSPNGFSKRLDRLFIVPKDIPKFIEQLPYGYG